jgi:DNA-binding NtrC family response regulator
LLHALQAISILGQYEAPVLITGETGTGKEMAARGLHYCGLRAEKPFIALNCATFTDDLFTSEFFGHKKGAFTDAREEKRGLLATAKGGTLFLDEIDSLTPKSQASLLRFLQAYEYRPVGSETVHRADVRIVTSSNRDLEALIANGEFRQDLYYRLYIFNIHMPALRQRPDDIPLLTNHFLAQFNHQYRLGEKTLSPGLKAMLREHHWPGNIRELENLIHRLYLSGTDPEIDRDALGILAPMHDLASVQPLATSRGESGQSCDRDIDPDPASENHSREPESAQTSFNFSRDKRAAIERFEKQYVARLLERAGGNVTRAANLCGKERRALGKLVKKYGLKNHGDDSYSTS